MNMKEDMKEDMEIDSGGYQREDGRKKERMGNMVKGQKEPSKWLLYRTYRNCCHKFDYNEMK